MNAINGDIYQWFQIIRGLLQHGAAALLSRAFLSNPCIEPASPDEIVVPKDIDLKDLSTQIKSYFETHSAIYQDHAEEYTLDWNEFSERPFVYVPQQSMTRKGKEGKREPVKQVNKIVLFDVLEKHNLELFKNKFTRYFHDLEELVRVWLWHCLGFFF